MGGCSQEPPALVDATIRFVCSRIEIHPTLRDGLVELYGTSDENGISHPIKPNAGEDVADPSLRVCSNALLDSRLPGRGFLGAVGPRPGEAPGGGAGAAADAH